MGWLGEFVACWESTENNSTRTTAEELSGQRLSIGGCLSEKVSPV